MPKPTTKTPRALLKNREELKVRNTKQLTKTVKKLSLTKPNKPWSYREVCTAAGLKSTVAIHKPWNSHIKSQIDSHNDGLTDKLTAQNTSCYSQLPMKNRILELTNIVRKLEQERDLALEKVAIWQAENEYLTREHQKLLRRLDAVRK